MSKKIETEGRRPSYILCLCYSGYSHQGQTMGHCLALPGPLCSPACLQLLDREDCCRERVEHYIDWPRKIKAKTLLLVKRAL